MLSKTYSLHFIWMHACWIQQTHLPLLPLSVWWGINPASVSLLPLIPISSPSRSLPHSFPSPHLSPLPLSLSSPESKPTMLISGSSSLWSLFSPLSLANGAFEVSLNSRAPNTHSWRRRHYLLRYLICWERAASTAVPQMCTHSHTNRCICCTCPYEEGEIWHDHRPWKPH